MQGHAQHTISWLDRLRIERVVWTLDQRLYDLPRRSRIEKRREVRANLLSAAHDVGTGNALRQLGNGRRLAMEYRDAEFGDTPRPSWIATIYFAGTLPLVLNWVLFEAAYAFRDGILAADPHATGSYVWSGLRYVQSTVTFSFTDGQATWVGGAWTPLLWALFIGGTVLVGRLWRIPLAWWRRRTPAT